MILQAKGTNHEIVLNTGLLTQAGVSGAGLRAQGGVIDVGPVDGAFLLADASLVHCDSQTVRFSAAADIQLGGIDAGGIDLVETDDILVGSVSVSPPRRDDDGNLIYITEAMPSDPDDSRWL